MFALWMGMLAAHAGDHPPPKAERVVIHVTDRHGTPIEGAVVLVPGPRDHRV